MTEKSPLRFRSGAFRLASRLEPEPLIVPIAVANLDKNVTRAVTAAVVHKPFRVSEVVREPADESELATFIDELRDQFRAWIREAATLADTST